MEQCEILIENTLDLEKKNFFGYCEKKKKCCKKYERKGKFCGKCPKK
jgi:hypothetical protein